VEQPVRHGFGTTSVIASIESQLGGKACFEWRLEGLICRLTVPLEGAAACVRTPPNLPFTATGPN
jgi:two-component sensor histidine kinase